MSKDDSTRTSRKLDINFIEDKARRHICFSKRRSGLVKKAHELSMLTGTEILLVVVSEVGNVNCYASERFQPIPNSRQLHSLLHTCLVSEEAEPEALPDTLSSLSLPDYPFKQVTDPFDSSPSP
ncbi:hypothetical protein GEMRC1_001508 [Eukaryota sp. GEM-RC1]